MIWTGREWKVKEHEHAGQPGVSIADGRVNFGVRGAWGGNPGQKIAALSFIAPKSGTYTLNATAISKPWDGGDQVRLRILKNDGQAVHQVARLELPKNQTVEIKDVSVPLAQGQQLVIVPDLGMHNASNITLRDLTITFSGG